MAVSRHSETPLIVSVGVTLAIMLLALILFSTVGMKVAEWYDDFRAPDTFEEYLAQKPNVWFFVDRKLVPDGSVKASAGIEIIKKFDQEQKISAQELVTIFALYDRLCKNFAETYERRRHHMDKNDRKLLNNECYDNVNSDYQRIKRAYRKQTKKAARRLLFYIPNLYASGVWILYRGFMASAY